MFTKVFSSSFLSKRNFQDVFVVFVLFTNALVGFLNVNNGKGTK